MISPLEIKRLPTNGISVRWSDNKTTEISSEILRRGCPCASCLVEKGDLSHEKPLTSRKSSLRVIEHTRSEQLELLRVWPIGNYALGLAWGDGHDSGIFTYQLLRELASESTNK